MALLELDDVKKEYTRGFAAVAGVSLAVPEREMLVLVGPSGCGKTTLLRLIAGLEQPTAGTIRLAGKALNHVPPGSRDVAMVFQNYALYPHKSVYENIAFPLRMRKVHHRELDTMVRRTAANLGLDGHLDSLPSRLSGGQQQRVALGRALVRQPKVFLFDEPLSNLDPQLRREMRWELKQFQRQAGIAAVYVTHDQEEAMSLADRLVVMQAGRLLQVGPPVDLYRDPAHRTVAELVGSPPMNILDGVLAREDNQLRLLESVPQPSIQLTSRLNPIMPYLGQKIAVGFRPDVVQLTRCEADDLHMNAQVVVAEQLGENTEHLLASGKGRRVVIRLPERQELGEGDRVELFVPQKSCYWFTDVGQRVSLESGQDHQATDRFGM